MASRAKVFLLLSKEVSLKNKTLVNYEIPLLQNRHVNNFCVHEGQSFLLNSWAVKQIVRTNFNFTFSTAAEGVERILKTVFELMFSKMT